MADAISVVKKRTGAHESTIRELNISADGIKVGKPLKNFSGVLTGVPIYSGAEAILDKGAND